MKKICIALDYNPSAEKVAETGYAYAKALGAKTVLVHVIADLVYYNTDYSPIMGYAYPGTSAGVDAGVELKQIAENFLSASADHLGGSEIRTRVLLGEINEAARTILEFCKTEHMDLLVIGTHSHSVLENVLMGNTAVKVVRHTPIPLLVVPTKK